jgi:hypothetical protein
MARFTNHIVSVALLCTGLLAPLAEAQPLSVPSTAEKLAALIAAYPDTLARAEGNTIVFKNGTRLPFDDATGPKDIATLLSAPDIEDMFALPYPKGRAALAPALNADPGRFRNGAFFKAMYGDCGKDDVTRNLVEIAWLPKRAHARIKVTKINGVAEHLAKVSAELDALPDRFTKYLVPAAGTYNCRPIAGTSRVSAHGFGIAIDIATKGSHYWRWAQPGPDGRYAYRNAIPLEIVSIFEKHGFIWGGRWYHYDTMHFEYRPEMLGVAR